MQEIGQQYSKDDRTDPSGFLRRARLHQSVFRAKYLELPFDTYGNYLTKEDGKKVKTFMTALEFLTQLKSIVSITSLFILICLEASTFLSTYSFL